MDDIELEDISSETPQVEVEEGETSFIEPEDESVLIIDGSNPVFTRVDGPSTSKEIPNVGRDVGVIRRRKFRFRRLVEIKKPRVGFEPLSILLEIARLND